MKSKTDKSHTLSEALDRMRAKTLAAEDRGEKTVSIGVEDASNLKEAAFRCNDYARMDNAQHSAGQRAAARARISTLESASKWATDRGLTEFADHLAGLAAFWERKRQELSL